MTTEHYILNLNPQAESSWDRCVLRNPLTGERSNLEAAIAKAVGDRAGSYLINVNIDVRVLQSGEPSLTVKNTVELPKLGNIKQKNNRLLAS
ncbi:hypothetical protein [Myxosarcina sp. GI1]|uniref:hypothetical protein n=1 Tax=Myxosarcina sp. GI1 TaxID=1541065 RepID=UPI0005619ED6|nr:hypothetical protein [Myxosarcina sp. GI1]